MRNIIVFIGILLLAGFTVYSYDPAAPVVNEEAPQLNYLAPSFQLLDINQQTTHVFDSSRVEGPVVINFWASWCGPCHVEAPDLKALHETYGDRVKMYALNSTELDSVSGAEDFVNQYGFSFSVPMDIEGEVTKRYQIQAFPTTFFIDEQGAVRDIALGSLTFEQMENKVKKLLK